MMSVLHTKIGFLDLSAVGACFQALMQGLLSSYLNYILVLSLGRPNNAKMFFELVLKCYHGKLDQMVGSEGKTLGISLLQEGAGTWDGPAC